MEHGPVQPSADRTAVLMGFKLCLDSPADVLESLWRALNSGVQTHVLTLNPEMLVLSQRDPAAAALLQRADLNVADGAGVAWAARLLLGRRIQRYPGIDLAYDLCARLARQGGSVYLLGSAPGVAEAAATKLTASLPGLSIAGCQHGFFGPEEESSVMGAVADSKADVLLVGMGCPRQEGLIAMYRGSLATPILIGVGGALDVWSGEKRRAPALVQKLSLEWLWRALTDHTRLKRLGALWSFVWLVLREKLAGARREAKND